VLFEHRCEAERLVLLGVALAADPEETTIEQANGACQDAVATQALRAQLFVGEVPNLRQRARELDHVIELLLVATPSPVEVVQVLLPPGCVDTDRLQVPVVERTYPHVSPRRRDTEVFDPLQRLEVVDAVSLRVEVFEAAPALPARDAGAGAIDPSQPGHVRPKPLLVNLWATSTQV
jgi:hypothetical protein